MAIRDLDELRLAVIGIGYVGLPLLVEFAKKREIVGYDVSKSRVRSLQQGRDENGEVKSIPQNIKKNIHFTDSEDDLSDANTYIITVPTPVDDFRKPDLSFVIAATKTVAKFINTGDLIIYESTVYPGVTEQVCAPIIEKISGKKYLIADEDDRGFYLGYSPERLSPGDTSKGVADIVKVTSGSTPKIANLIDSLYASISNVGTYKSPSISVAEAAKVIENTQRDVNIAFMNELSIIFNEIGIDTQEVIKAAQTKWNFLPFSPGLVGGHCIGVDPYYLAHLGIQKGHRPDILLAARNVNESMGKRIVDRVTQLMIQKGIGFPGANILILGLTFKENCKDTRNSKVFEIIREFTKLRCNINVFDPFVGSSSQEKVCPAKIIDELGDEKYDAIVLTVAHTYFKDMGIDALKTIAKKPSVIYDVKSIFPRHSVDGRL